MLLLLQEFGDKIYRVEQQKIHVYDPLYQNGKRPLSSSMKRHPLFCNLLVMSHLIVCFDVTLCKNR